MTTRVSAAHSSVLAPRGAPLNGLAAALVSLVALTATALQRRQVPVTALGS